MRIFLVGGGTGGHFYPLIAIAEAVRDRDIAQSQTTELFYIGPEPYNADELARLNIRFVSCPAGKQRRYRSILNLFDLLRVLLGIFVACKKLYFYYPDVIMSKGGYTSVPVVIAAWLLRIPIVIHESDATPGRANTLAAKFATYIAISFQEAAAFFPADKIIFSGIPIRKYFFAPTQDPYQLLGVSPERPILFVTGGSQGAERVNNLILDSLDELLPNYTIIHQVGESHVDTVSRTAGSLISDIHLLDNYFVYGHMDGKQFAAAQYASNIIISRAGSGTIAEISLVGKPSIIIPIPEEISHDQRTNAYAYARSGAATVMEEKNLTDALLTAEINAILGDKARYQSMHEAALQFCKKDAAYILADQVLVIGQSHRW